MTEQLIKEIDIESDEYKRAFNDYSEYVGTYMEGFVANLFSNGIVTEIGADKLKEYFSNPDKFQKEIEDLAQYYYITTAETHQLFELVESLPTLNYKLDSFDKPKNNDKHISTLNKILHKVKHKKLTRDLLKQTTAAGTLVGMWIGDKSKPHPYIFDEMKYVFPAYRQNGDWLCVIDMGWFSEMTDFNRNIQFRNLSPFVTKSDYDKYLENPIDYQYKDLPQDRTFTLRTGTLKRNQSLGTSWITPGLYDVLHKKKLKDVESSIANKIINAVAVLTVGSEKNPEYANMKLNPKLKKKIHSGVKAALEKNQQNGVTVVTIPEYADLTFPDVKADGLDGDKFEHINNDIQAGYGISGAILNGNTGNYSTAKLNLDTIYKRLGVLLEDIEQEVYQKLFNLVLPSSQSDNYYLVYDKETPLTLKEKLDVLIKLNDKGWSIKHVVDHLAGVSWESYLEQTLYETEELKLQTKIKPYQSTYTMSDSNGGAPSVDDPTNENTIQSKTIDGNNSPT
ncbi:hypothetical protein NSS71_08695 [Niallia sp. FSL W8-0951]|uniref:hypothetical protein n=1 Tax=Niallia sp. FSL W8-0951 TaxID=2954639 RepID=UPI0030FC339F